MSSFGGRDFMIHMSIPTRASLIGLRQMWKRVHELDSRRRSVSVFLTPAMHGQQIKETLARSALGVRRNRGLVNMLQPDHLS